MTLGDDDKAGIEQTIDDEVLKGTAISFESDAVKRRRRPPRGLGELELGGRHAPIAFELDRWRRPRQRHAPRSSRPTGASSRTRALFGTLKVLDEVQVAIDGSLTRLLAASVAVDGLGVEAALDAGRQLAAAVRVQRDVGDRLRARVVAAATNAPLSQRRLSAGASERHPGEQLRLVEDLAGGAGDRRRGAAATAPC